MGEKIVRFFVERHLLANLMTATVLIGGILLWNLTPKEELPEMEMNTVRIGIVYPGASPGEVEYFVTRPVEDKLRGVDGIYRITSTSSSGLCSIIIELDEKAGIMSEMVTEIQNAVLSVSLPDEVRDTPSVRQFKTSRKAIIDLGLFIKGKHILDDDSRRLLQESMYDLENRLIKQPEINSVNREGYLKKELRVEVNPVEILNRNMSLTEVMNAVTDSHVRRPAGDLENTRSERVNVRGEVDTPAKLRETVIRGTFEGQLITLGEVARVKNTFAKPQEIIKINGHEGIILNVVKNSSSGIIEAVARVNAEVKRFSDEKAKDGITVAVLDDESRDVVNRLALIGSNGAIGFVLIFLTLIAFLNMRSAFWVAMGIPFSLSFTFIVIYLMGMTINNITLAGIIIVLGMVVDDAIVVAENIVRREREGETPDLAAVNGTKYVMLPVVASVLTTCVAFLPLLGVEGRIGKMNSPIPVIITVMLLGSLLESLTALPSHMSMHMPPWWYALKTKIREVLFRKKAKFQKKNALPDDGERHWFDAVEKKYESFLHLLLHNRKKVMLFFLLLPVGAAILFATGMKFVMFPGEEVQELLITASTPKDTRKYETARMAEPFERVLDRYIGKEIVGYRTMVARSRFGSAAEENSIMWRIELIPLDKRSKSQPTLEREWKKELSSMKNLSKVRVREMRFGQQSGSSIAILVQDNNDKRREKAADRLAADLSKLTDVINVEIDRPMTVTEHQIGINRQAAATLGISSTRAGTIVRSVVEGSILYELVDEDSEIDVRVTVPDRYKQNIGDVLSMPVANQGSYLVPLRDMTVLTSTPAPASIKRLDFLRTTIVYADLKKGSDETPLTVAEKLEKNVFPKLAREFGRTMFSFDGEIKDTRESSGNLKLAVIVVIFLIYIIMAILFNSMTKPLIIMLSIPFGAAGVVIAFKLHGINHFGFFAAVGIIGLSGVVVNDAIVMTVTMIDTAKDSLVMTPELISKAASTRIRAVFMTTITTVAGLMPTAYGVAGYDSMLAEMMLAMAWGLLISTFITLVLVPVLFSYLTGMKKKRRKA